MNESRLHSTAFFVEEVTEIGQVGLEHIVIASLIIYDNLFPSVVSHVVFTIFGRFVSHIVVLIN